jgi:hypothetical protein
MRPRAGMGLAAGAEDLLRTAGLPAIRVVPLSAGRALAQVSRAVRLPVVLQLPVRGSPHEPSTGASAILASACDSELAASGAIATTTATDAWVLMGGETRVSTIPIGGRILVRRSTMTSNTRLA